MPLIVSCGLDCNNCAAYKATQTKDMDRLAELAVQWGGDSWFKAENKLISRIVPQIQIYSEKTRQ